MEVHFPKLGHAVDAVDRWTAVDVEQMLEAEAFVKKDLFSAVCKIDSSCRFWHTRINTFCFHLNGMAWWPGNERDHVFTAAKRHDQVKEQSRNNLILEQGSIGAATLLEKNTRLDWAFATTENQHSIGDVGSIVDSFMLINAGDHRFLHIDSRKTG